MSCRFYSTTYITNVVIIENHVLVYCVIFMLYLHRGNSPYGEQNRHVAYIQYNTKITSNGNDIHVCAHIAHTGLSL